MYWSGPAQYVPDYAAPRFRLTPKHHAYVKIAEGCNHPCTFCSIPRIRGKHRSRARADVLAEIRGLVAAGTREINLISQDTTFYGKDLDPQAPGPRDGKGQLCELLREIQQIDGDFWVRLLYTHPYHWTDELIETIAACDKVCRYVDMPLQHINDEMLKQMRRETSGRVHSRPHRAHSRGRSRHCVAHDVYRRFPGRNRRAIRGTAGVHRGSEIRASRHVPVFAGGPHAGGSDARAVAAREKKKRYGRAMALQQKISREVQRGFVGKTVRVLIDEQRDGGWLGRSHADAPEIDGSVLR